MRCLLHDEPCNLQLCHETGECSFPTVCYPSASQPDPTPQDVAAPTLEQLAPVVADLSRDAENGIFRDAERYRKLREVVYATSDESRGGERVIGIDIDWGNIPDGTDAEMLDAAVDQL